MFSDHQLDTSGTRTSIQVEKLLPLHSNKARNGSARTPRREKSSALSANMPAPYVVICRVRKPAMPPGVIVGMGSRAKAGGSHFGKLHEWCMEGVFLQPIEASVNKKNIL